MTWKNYANKMEIRQDLCPHLSEYAGKINVKGKYISYYNHICKYINVHFIGKSRKIYQKKIFFLKLYFHVSTVDPES